MKELREQIHQTDKQIKETGKQMKETDQRIGALTSKLGKLIEYTVLPNIEKKFRELGYLFTKSSPHVKYWDQQTDKVLAEVDILIENGVYVMAVEVKMDLSTKDVDEHIERMEVVSKYADEHEDKRKYLGAVAGGIVSESAKKYARRKGFFVLEQTGDTVKIAETPKEWKPREW
jgi:predicted AAA+ superfamily ATPase